jgi:hypothetical protein
MYKVIDTTGALLRAFRTRREAEIFRTTNSRYDWQIIECYY